MEMSMDLFDKKLALLKFTRQAKETEKAYCLIIDDIKRWIPKSVCELLPDKNEVLLPEWFIKKMDEGGALFSDDDSRRYVLWRTWNKKKKVALCIGLNPSTAQRTTMKDDPTINRLVGTLIEQDYGGMRMVNLYSIISSSPAILMEPKANECRDLDMGLIVTNALLCQDVIFCWGAFTQARERAQAIIELFPDAKCFGNNKDGSPWHPMALMYAGLKADTTKLFTYRDHAYEKNHYASKSRQRKQEFNMEQMQLIPPDIA